MRENGDIKDLFMVWCFKLIIILVLKEFLWCKVVCNVILRIGLDYMIFVGKLMILNILYDILSWIIDFFKDCK